MLPPRPALAVVPEKGHGSRSAVLNCVPFQAGRGKLLQFQSFDQGYLSLLQAGDAQTREHFGAYFSALIQLKLRSRLASREAIDDVQQETFARFYAALQSGKIRHPERLGSFVNSICNNVLAEHYRSAARHVPLDEEEEHELPGPTIDLLEAMNARQTEKQVRDVVAQLPERDSRLLREVFLEDRDKDEVCRRFGVDRDYLRVLLHRAKQSFKSLYLKEMGGRRPIFPSA